MLVNGDQPILRGEINQLPAMSVEKRRGENDEGFGAGFPCRLEHAGNSSERFTLRTCNRSPRERAVAWVAAACVGSAAGSRRTATRLTLGRTSLSNSARFALISVFSIESPVTL